MDFGSPPEDTVPQCAEVQQATTSRARVSGAGFNTAVVGFALASRVPRSVPAWGSCTRLCQNCAKTLRVERVEDIQERKADSPNCWNR